LVCLAAAGSISVSGCTTPTTADLNPPAKKSPQVASASRPSTAQKAPPKLAAKDASGKARISDVNDATKSQMVAKKSPPKSDASKQPASQVRRPKTQLASATVDPQAPSSSRSRVSKADANAVAVKPRKPAAPSSSAAGDSSEVASGTFLEYGAVKQTSGNGQPALAAKKKTAESKRRAPQPPKPAVSELPEPESEVALLAPQTVSTDSVMASSHERRRADRLMAKAHESYNNGYPEEALRLASVAVELEKSRQAHYRRGEERPSDYITWLQSIIVSRNGNPPVIRPQMNPGQQPTNVSDVGASITSAGAETSGQRRNGDVIRANGGSSVAPSADMAAEAANVTRSNTGVDLAASDSPRFATDERPASRAGANVSQVEVPVPPQPRSADAGLANGNAPNLDAPAVPEPSPPDATSDGLRKKSSRTWAPQVAARDKSAEISAAAEAVVDDSQVESDAFAESEMPGFIPVQTSQLTIASLVGLITGVAGMFGLSWWRRQEQRHYAEGK
jgi:hypothetical protein